MLRCTKCHGPASVTSIERDGYTVAIRVACTPCGIVATKVGGVPEVRVEVKR